MKRTDLEHLAALAKLSFTSEEFSRLEGEMEAIMSFVSHLPSCTSEEQTAFSSVQEVCREDIPHPFVCREEILAGAPSIEDGCIIVPRVVED